MPSGGPSRPSAKVRRSLSDPSGAMVNAVNRRPVDSATIRVVRSGVITIPLGKSRSSATMADRAIGIDSRDDAALACLRSDICAPGGVDDHVAEVRRHEVGQIGDRFDGVSVVAQELAVARRTRSATCRRAESPGRTGGGRAAEARSGRPCRLTVCTASPSMSENHSSPSNQRGPSPKQKPSASVVSVSAPLQITAQVSRSQGATVN